MLLKNMCLYQTSSLDPLPEEHKRFFLFFRINTVSEVVFLNFCIHKFITIINIPNRDDSFNELPSCLNIHLRMVCHGVEKITLLTKFLKMTFLPFVTKSLFWSIFWIWCLRVFYASPNVSPNVPNRIEVWVSGRSNIEPVDITFRFVPACSIFFT